MLVVTYARPPIGTRRGGKRRGTWSCSRDWSPVRPMSDVSLRGEGWGVLAGHRLGAELLSWRGASDGTALTSGQRRGDRRAAPGRGGRCRCGLCTRLWGCCAVGAPSVRTDRVESARVQQCMGVESPSRARASESLHERVTCVLCIGYRARLGNRRGPRGPGRRGSARRREARAHPGTDPRRSRSRTSRVSRLLPLSRLGATRTKVP